MSGAFIVKSRLEGQVVHPGVILFQHYMDPYGISQTELALFMGVSPRRVNEIVQGKRAITADTAIRLEEVLGMGADYWMYLQADYEIETTRARGVPMPNPLLAALGRKGMPD